MERGPAQGHCTDPHANSERTLTIKAPTSEAGCNAVRTVFSRLRQFYESDMNQRSVPGSAVSLSNVSAVSGGHSNQQHDANGYIPTSVSSGPPMPILVQHAPQVSPANIANLSNLCKVHVYVPNGIVGALIGAKGSHIRNMMRLTGAVIRIEANADIGSFSSKESIRSDKESSKESKLPEGVEANNGEENPVPEETAANGEELAQSVEVNGSAGGLKPSQSLSAESSSEASDTKERCVTVTGTDQQIFKAEFWIFQRVAENSLALIDEVVLNSLLSVPTSMVGRIIGKSGANVRELQRITQSQVRVFEDPNAQQHADREETMVRITGNFFSTQAVQARLSHLITECRQRIPSDRQSISDQPAQAPEAISVETAAPQQPEVTTIGP
ncbi:KH domain-containing protein [Aphelenchoides avenae]|nr:KH domain-containing protein [Aphelenchus avenae]